MNDIDQIKAILRIVRDAGALDDNNGAEDWTHSDKQIDQAAKDVAALLFTARKNEMRELSKTIERIEDSTDANGEYIKTGLSWYPEQRLEQLTSQEGVQ
jgi:hypothetical protein